MSERLIARVKKTLEKQKILIEREITSELEPFLDGIRTIGTTSRDFGLFKEAYAYFENKYERKREILRHILRDAETEFQISSVKDKIYMLFVYLGTVESVANAVVDILVMLLVANGRDFHIECRGYRTPRIRHVASIKDDLEEERVPLGTKLSFLRENGIKRFTSVVDSELRNAIAHLKFDIKKNEIFVKGQPAPDIFITSWLELSIALGTAEKLLNQLAEERGLIPKKE